MRIQCRWAAGAVFLLLVPGPAAAATRQERELNVATPGWVRVPLPADTLQSDAGSGVPNLQVLGPDGRALPVIRRLAVDESGRRAAKVLGVEETGTGWFIGLDLGADPPRHDRLTFDLELKAIARGCRLEASADGQSWNWLATGDLFRLGEGAGLTGTSLVYPAASHRYLRLFWPATAGYPEVRRIEVEGVSARGLEVETGAPECASAAGSTVCRLNFGAPVAALRRLDLTVEGAEPVGFRVLRAAQGTWQVVAEGLWTELSGPRSLQLGTLGGRGESLRLELSAEPGSSPKVTHYRALFESEELLFEAPSAGWYRLVYGAGVPAPSLAASTPPRAAAMPRVEPGAAVATPVSAAPLPIEGAAAPSAHFAAIWRVDLAEPQPGTRVHLPLPGEVYAAAREDLGDLRLITEGRQVPFVVHRPDEPELAGEQRGLAAKTNGERRFEILLPGHGLPVTQLVLTARGRRFEMPVRVELVAAARPGVPERREGLALAAWRCDPWPPLPCRLAMDLPAWSRRAEKLVLTLDSGDDAPLEELDAALLQQREELVFVRPSGGADLRLQAGAPELAAPRYALEGFQAELFATPEGGTAKLVGGSENAPGTSRRGKIALWIALAVGGVFLLGLLARILRESH